MAANVTTLFAGQGEGGSKALGEALKAYWGGDRSAALETAAAALAADPEGPDRFHAYRLWIEVLAEDGDMAGLGELAEHLLLRGQADPEDHVTYQALRGLAHFERDEFVAARLLSSALQNFAENPFCLELVQMVRSREATVPGMPDLLRSTTGIADYFHARTLARGLLVAGEASALGEALKGCARVFPGSPLREEYEFHRQIDAGEFAGAAVTASELVRRFPTNFDFQFQEGFALFKAGAFAKAKDSLAKALRLSGAEDSDILALIGHCHRQLGNFEEAIRVLERASVAREQDGLPSLAERTAITSIREELSGTESDPSLAMPQQTRTWLTYLSPRRYHELLSGSEQEIGRLVRPMGTAPRPGDLCFFASQERGGKLKIAAIYMVDSEPVWHPVHGHESALQLVERPPVAIPVDVAILDEEEADVTALDLEAGHPFHYGLYELEAGALDIITEAVRRRREGNEPVARGRSETA